MTANQFRLERVSFDGSEPVSLQTAKQHCRVDHSEDDELLVALISAAREHAELVTGQTLLPSTWRLTLDRFPQGGDSIRLPRVPARSVSITYRDLTGTLQTLSPSLYEADSARISPAFGQRWPATRPGISGVAITFTAGYSASELIPETIRQALLLMIGSWYANREDVIVSTGQAQTLPRAAEFMLALNKTSHVGYEVAS